MNAEHLNEGEACEQPEANRTSSNSEGKVGHNAPYRHIAPKTAKAHPETF